jgi:transposase InsO family protein
MTSFTHCSGTSFTLSRERNERGGAIGMTWRSVDLQEQRVRFVVAASRREKTFRALCQEFEVSRPTGYVWWRRYREQGLAGIAERSRRPRLSPGQTDGAREQRVVELRQRYPDWGARKLQVLLRQAGVSLPASTIHRILLRRGLVRIYDRHPPALQRFERAAPNELWQMDFKGSTGWDTAVGPLSVLDDHSRYLIALQGTWSTKAEPVRERLESAFSECGVPEAMLMDHGTPWWNAKAPTGATWLTVWLMRQGIELHWSGYRHPQTQGKVERFHGSLQRAQGRRGVPAEQRQQWLDEYRCEYNQVRPHEALGMQTPASRWQKSERRYDPNPPQWQYPEGAEVVKVGGHGQIWAGRRWEISYALAGQWVQLVRLEERVLVYHCRTVIRELNLASQRSTAVERRLAD